MEEDNQKEIIVAEPIRKSPVVLVMYIFFITILIDAMYAAALSVFLLINPAVTSLTFFGLLVLVIIKYMAQTYILMRVILNWANEIYYLADNHLICRKGILDTTEHLYPCKIIRSVSVHQSILGKWLNYGDLIVEVSASGGYHERVHIEAVCEPQKCEGTLKERLATP